MTIQTIWKVARVFDEGRFLSLSANSLLVVIYELGRVAKPPVENSRLFCFTEFEHAKLFAAQFFRFGDNLVILEGQGDVDEAVSDVIHTIPMLHRFDVRLQVELARAYWAAILDGVEWERDEILSYALLPDYTKFASWFKPEEVVWRLNSYDSSDCVESC